ncbi:unnamed protein product [Schistosoma turkestanicum]|nr:unnamed protein product [Schistosoma turkestanicum]
MNIWFLYLLSALISINFCVSNHTLNVTNPKVLLISLEGFRFDYFDMARSRNINISIFEKIINYGVYVKQLETVFPSLPYPTKYSMVTGLYPESHGVVHDYLYDPIMNEQYREWQYVPKNSTFFNVGAEPIWVTNQMQGYQSGVINWIGSNVKIKGILPTKTMLEQVDIPSIKSILPNLMNWFNDDNKKFNLGLISIYQPYFDGYVYGVSSDQVLQSIEQINHDLGLIVSLIEKQPWISCCLNVIITSSHGMTTISETRRIFLDDYLPPNEYVTTDNKFSSIFTLWPNQGFTKQSLYQKLKGKHPKLNVYFKEELPANFFYKSSVRIGPIVLFADLGWVIIRRRSDHEQPFVSFSGYAPHYDEMKTFLMAIGPNIPVNKSLPIPGSLKVVDIYLLICQLLDLKPAPNDGSLTRILPLINKKNTASNNRLSFLSLIKYIAFSIFITHSRLLFQSN